MAAEITHELAAGRQPGRRIDERGALESVQILCLGRLVIQIDVVETERNFEEVRLRRRSVQSFRLISLRWLRLTGLSARFGKAKK